MDQSVIAVGLSAMGIATDRLVSVTIRFDGPAFVEVVRNSREDNGSLTVTSVKTYIERGK